MARTCFLLVVILLNLHCKNNQQAKTTAIPADKKETIDKLTGLARETSPQNFEEAANLLQKAKAIATGLNNDSLLAFVDFLIAKNYRNHGLEDSAAPVVDKWLQLLSYSKYKDIYLDYKFEKQDMYFGPGNYKEGIAYALEFIKEATQYGDTSSMIYCTSDIGCGLNDMGQNRESLNWLKKADSISLDKKYDKLKAGCALYLNMAEDYIALQQYDSAVAIAKKSLELCKENNYTNLLGSSYSTIGLAMSYQQKKEALDYVNEATRVLDANGRAYFKLFTTTNTIHAYANLGYPQKGIQLARQLIDTLKKNPIVPLDLAYKALAKCYKVQRNFSLYASTMDTLNKIRDEVYAKNSEKEIADFRVKYEVAEKEKKIAEQALTLRKRKETQFILIGVFVLMAITGLLFFRSKNQRIKLKQRILLAEEKAKTQLAILEAETKERSRIASDLHDNLGAYANAVLYGTEQLQEEKNRLRQQELIKSLQFSSKEVILSLRETIWALKKDYYTDQECLARVQNFTKTLKNYYPEINFITTPFEITNQRLVNTDALNIVRIIQEAMTNSIKHAAATVINTTFTKDVNSWQITVCDNGAGFDIGRPYDYLSHSGLQNMQARAKESGMEFQIRSEPGQGTCVMILFPVQRLLASL